MKLVNGWERMSVELVNPEHLAGWEERVYKMAAMTWHTLDDVPYDPTPDSPQHSLVWGAFEGKTLPTVLEQLSLQFIVRGVTRACSHQLVRGRIGWVYNQQSQSAEPIRNDVALPAHVYSRPEFREKADAILRMQEELYDEMIAARVPPQSARYVLPEGSLTDLYVVTNFPALRGMVGNRTCWSTNDEINFVARMMRKAVLEVEPRWDKYLKQFCDRTGKCNLVDPVFPTCGKYPGGPSKGVYGNAENNTHIEMGKRPELAIDPTDVRTGESMLKFHRKGNKYDESL